MDPLTQSRPHQSPRDILKSSALALLPLGIPSANYSLHDQQPMTANGSADPIPIPWLDKNGSHNQPGREHFHAGNAERHGGRSAALAGAGLDSHSRTNELQDGLEINRRMRRSATLPLSGKKSTVVTTTVVCAPRLTLQNLAASENPDELPRQTGLEPVASCVRATRSNQIHLTARNLATTGGTELQNHSCCFTEIRFLSTIRDNERASYNGSIEASQASDVGSIPIARSINLVDSVALPLLRIEMGPIGPRFWTQVGPKIERPLTRLGMGQPVIQAPMASNAWLRKRISAQIEDSLREDRIPGTPRSTIGRLERDYIL